MRELERVAVRLQPETRAMLDALAEFYQLAAYLVVERAVRELYGREAKAQRARERRAGQGDSVARPKARRGTSQRRAGVPHAGKRPHDRKRR